MAIELFILEIHEEYGSNDFILSFLIDVSHSQNEVCGARTLREVAKVVVQFQRRQSSWVVPFHTGDESTRYHCSGEYPYEIMPRTEWKSRYGRNFRRPAVDRQLVSGKDPKYAHRFVQVEAPLQWNYYSL